MSFGRQPKDTEVVYRGDHRRRRMHRVSVSACSVLTFIVTCAVSVLGGKGVEMARGVMKVAHEDFSNLQSELAYPNYDGDRSADLFVVLFIAEWSTPMQALAHEYDRASPILHEASGKVVAERSATRDGRDDAENLAQHQTPRAILQKVDVEDSGAAPLLRRFGIVGHPTLLFFWKDGDKVVTDRVDFSELRALVGANGLSAEVIVQLVRTIYSGSAT